MIVGSISTGKYFPNFIIDDNEDSYLSENSNLEKKLKKKTSPEKLPPIRVRKDSDSIIMTPTKLKGGHFTSESPLERKKVESVPLNAKVFGASNSDRK